ncbi:MAG: MFS transporter [Limisphaerales bacterium]
MNKAIRLKLFAMMVLEFVIWGCWLPLIYNYLPSLGFSLPQQFLILNAFPAAAVVGMFFSSQFADRHFSAEKFLAFSHFVSGLALLGLATIKAAAPVAGLAAGQPNPNAPFWPFFTLMLVHCLLYVPTNSIANSIAFANMKDPQKEFGLIRVGGTIGWILAAWPFTFILVDWNQVHGILAEWDKFHPGNPHGPVKWLGAVLGSGLSGQPLQEATRWTFVVAGIASLVLAAYSLMLPHTPPKKVERGADRFAWLEAIKLLRHPFVLVLWLVTLVDAFVIYCYFNWTGSFLGAKVAAGGVGIGGNWIMPVMSIGQVAEGLTMLILGATLKRLGWRWTMVIGILGHTARFAVYAFWPEAAPVILVQLLHGVCYAFFFATVYIFVDEYFPKDVRASAQGLFNAVILGIGPLVANIVCPYLMQKTFTHDGVTDFRSLFLVPLAAATLGAIVLGFCFHPPPKKAPTPSPEAALAA